MTNSCQRCTLLTFSQVNILMAFIQTRSQHKQRVVIVRQVAYWLRKRFVNIPAWIIVCSRTLPLACVTIGNQHSYIKHCCRTWLTLWMKRSQFDYVIDIWWHSFKLKFCTCYVYDNQDILWKNYFTITNVADFLQTCQLVCARGLMVGTIEQLL